MLSQARLHVPEVPAAGAKRLAAPQAKVSNLAEMAELRVWLQIKPSSASSLRIFGGRSAMPLSPGLRSAGASVAAR